MYQYIKYKNSYFAYYLSEDICIRSNRKTLNLEFELEQTLKEPVLYMIATKPYRFESISIDSLLEEKVNEFITVELYQDLIDCEDITDEKDLEELKIKLKEIYKTVIKTLKKMLRKENLI